MNSNDTTTTEITTPNLFPVKTAKKSKPAKVTAQPTKSQVKKEQFATRDKELCKKYKHMVTGTMKPAPKGSKHEGKMTAVITCTTKGCGATRRVATSDLFQVHFCEKCQIEVNKARRRKPAKGQAFKNKK